MTLSQSNRPVIRAEKLGKQYHIGKLVARYQTAREAITDAVAAPIRRGISLLKGQSRPSDRPLDTIWALDDISFEIEQSEVVGIIGRNGSGKSTLLKVLAGITEPSRGRAEIVGRIGSLLEVGTGFHPELTGRENIYLSGAILGMRRREIQSRFERIVEFSGIEKFIDTPVKFYSSGMYLRLAFSVAAHLETEIVLIDEVLAVGDAVFQKKCIDKITSLARSGRTVLFVSHNLAAVNRLCSRGILLDAGRIVTDGPVAEVVNRYFTLLETGGGNTESTDASRLDLNSFRIENHTDYTIEADIGLVLGCIVTIPEEMESVSVRLSIRNAENQLLVHSRMEDTCNTILRKAGRYMIRISLPALWLTPGPYALQLKMIGNTGTKRKQRVISDPLMITIRNEQIDRFELPGLISPPARWELLPV